MGSVVALGKQFRVPPIPLGGHALYQQVFVDKVQNGSYTLREAHRMLLHFEAMVID